MIDSFLFVFALSSVLHKSGFVVAVLSLMIMIVLFSVAVEVPAQYLALWVRLDLPAPGKLHLCICKLIEEVDQVPVVLVPLKVTCIPTDFQNHVLQTGAVGEHPVGPLEHASAWSIRLSVA